MSSFLNLPTTTAVAAAASANSKPQAGEGVKGGVAGSRDSVAAAPSSSSVGSQAVSGCLSNNSGGACAQKGAAPLVTGTQGAQFLHVHVYCIHMSVVDISACI